MLTRAVAVVAAALMMAGGCAATEPEVKKLDAAGLAAAIRTAGAQAKTGAFTLYLNSSEGSRHAEGLFRIGEQGFEVRATLSPGGMPETKFVYSGGAFYREADEDEKAGGKPYLRLPRDKAGDDLLGAVFVRIVDSAEPENILRVVERAGTLTGELPGTATAAKRYTVDLDVARFAEYAGGGAPVSQDLRAALAERTKAKAPVLPVELGVDDAGRLVQLTVPSAEPATAGQPKPVVNLLYQRWGAQIDIAKPADDQVRG
ncbi:hypothetical protein [Amycolatopsis suaedae]|uniref:LppX_LprAFG lipoprotein n=1 Tax=Amycolatopsis suaedae TaxID=2510978 RepID=A0A4Q7JFX8_9PSEU|nr:hypothetical protein [Amycolatopsis suaedae]RZQ65584.1 hypothetical protein EWH70_00330 [Amycolatopsis suaedae]